MSNPFSGHILVEKLSKLNNSQQSIETLSQWCISHRQKAKQVVETWDKLFKGSQREQRVAFLYLANDILQNSRRKGSDFVNEFWKFLPTALKDVFENSDDHGKKAVSRLVDIWDERKVFGSRGRSLKDEMLGKDSLSVVGKDPPLLENKVRSTNPIKIVKKDAHSVRLKLAVGGMPERIVTAFDLVHEEHNKEDTVLNKCKAAVRHVGKLEKDVESASTHGNQQVSVLRNDLQEQENVLRQCLEQLQSVEAARKGLIFQLKEALQEQETKLEIIHTQYQVAQAQIEQTSNMRQRLGSSPPTESCVVEASTGVIETSSTNTPPPPLPHPTTCSFATMKAASDDGNKKAAAAVAAKLAAMTSSAQMLTSVLSSLAAEEAACMNGVQSSGLRHGSLGMFPPEKKMKLEKPMAPITEMGNSIYFKLGQEQQLPNVLLPANSETSTTSVKSETSLSQLQIPPPPPPLPSVPPPPPPPVPPPPIHQYNLQSSNAMMGGMQYSYTTNSLPPPPPFLGLARVGSQQQQQQQQQQLEAQRQAAAGGYYQSPGVGFYGQNHQQQQRTPPLPRQ